MLHLLKNRLKPFLYPNYRKYFFIQTVSMVGTWSHELARAWIVLEIMGNAAGLGLIALAAAIPSLFLMLQGGVIADKKEVKLIITLTRIALGLSAFAFAYITEFGDIKFWHIILFSVIEGMALSFDTPALQSIQPRLIDRKYFQQALALNSSNFHLSRALGPLVAGLLMAYKGPSLVFLVDGISYFLMLAVVRSLNLEPISRPPTQQTQSHLASLWDGLKHLFSNMTYKVLQLLLTVTLIFPALVTILRTFIKLKFDLTEDSFGYVFSAPATGSFVAALYFVIAKFKNPMTNLIYAFPGLILCLVGLTFVESIESLVVLLFFCGAFSYLNFAAITHSMHLSISDDYRGRMGSVIGLAFMSIGPLMSYPVGYFADRVGYEMSIYYICALHTLLSCIFAIKWGLLRPDPLHSGRPSV